ncbi:nucleotidyltransferase domain-containing protein [Marinifilum caeruleilacunae]|uniref:Cyclic GMP-AMP synthase n=1 Tax=Marinifilum caeruleilacunae TaxID=2499076 RepID=A0ABX1WS18_9BACT|nr:nucleotidyltransferase [Marinifilum caeruleilacunae]NOU58887.1 nucleotidyltransferase [Marinifilum caeruleilacunae]
MMTPEQKIQINDLLENLGESLDINETQYNAAVDSYQAVGKWLSDEKSSLAPYMPEILPQGSFMLGTMIKPINENDDMDIDLVCQLKGKNPNWAQYGVKQKVGDRIKDNETYKKMLDDEGRRCWTLEYRQDSPNIKERYHMDILPAVVDSGYREVLEKAFAATDLGEVNDLAIRITDNQDENYYSDTNHLNWMKSNPFGYGKWFFNIANIDFKKAIWMSEAVQPVPKYQENKLPLQRVIQILKRHRDIMFNGDEHKPISIIITTLSAKAYRREGNIMDALVNIVNQLELEIEERYSEEHGRMIKWIGNPVNQEENFADKWPENPKKQENFYSWLNQVKKDISALSLKPSLPLIVESLKRPFGEDVMNKAFNAYGERLLKKREVGALKMARGTGILGAVGETVKNHNFHG